MNIRGTSSYILVDIDEKTVKIQGEMLVNGFVAYADTIQYWQPPHDDERIDESTKQHIIDKVSAQRNEAGYKITFE